MSGQSALSGSERAVRPAGEPGSNGASGTQLKAAEPVWGTAGGEALPFSVVAHELRGPMAGIVASTEAILEDFEILEREQIRKIVAAAHRRAVFLQSLLENLLYADSTGRLDRICLLDALAEVRVVVEPLLAERRQRLRTRAVGGIPDLLADGRRLTQALINLVLNASKFSPIGTPISIIVGYRDGRVSLAVLDEGPGLPPGDLSCLFVAGHRGREARSPGQGGLGLGLSVVKAIVEGHGGTVQAVNRPGGGACFRCDIPMDPACALGSSPKEAR